MMLTHPRVAEILHYWFGNVENPLPNTERTHLWFAGEAKTDAEINARFGEDLQKAINGEYVAWEESARGSLALIILFDQFARHIYRGTATAYIYDQKALDLCLLGIQKEFDHSLSLLERAFFYMPLMHSESLEMQKISVHAFEALFDLSLPEPQMIFKAFLDYAVKHYQVIEKFGRFPTRNAILGRDSTPAELQFLNSSKAEF